MTPAPNIPDGPAPVSAPVRAAAYVVALVLLLVGALGFVPGVTSDLGDMEFAGPASESMLFGVFRVSALHNLIHLLLGVLGLVMAWRARPARAYLIVSGLIYLALFGYGLIIDQDADANVLAVNTADTLLHLGLGVILVLVSLLPRKWPERGDKPDGTDGS